MIYVYILGDKWIPINLLLHNGMPNGIAVFMEGQNLAYRSFSKFKKQPRDYKQK